MRSSVVNGAAADVSEMPRLFEKWLQLDDDSEECAALYTRTRTFWLFLYQVLTPGMSCQEVVHKALVWFYCEGIKGVSPNTGAYCQARARLEINWLMDLARSVAAKLEAAEEILTLAGRRVFLVDGSSSSMPDTPENQARWPQPSGQRKGVGFPTLRLMAVFSATTGALLGIVWTPLECAEATLWRMLWSNFRRGDIVVGDRGFCGIGSMMLLVKRGIDCVFRQNGRRSAGITQVRKLGKGDRLVNWSRDKHTPKWLEWSLRSELPNTMLIREITFTLDIKGWRSQHFTVATTLLNPVLYPREEIMKLYYRRWHAELRLRDLKTTMGMEVLHTKSPEMIEREIAMYWIAYNLLRGLMVDAAVAAGRDPIVLSFKACLSLTRQWSPYWPASEHAADVMLRQFLQYLAQQILRTKPGRVEPRALKRRPKTYARLTGPRREFQEMPHRNRYKKPALTPVAATA